MTLDDKLPDDETRKMFTRMCRGFKTDEHPYWTEKDRPEGAYCPDCKNKWDLEYQKQINFVQHCEGFLRDRHSYFTKHYQNGCGNIYCPDCMNEWQKLHPPQNQPDFKQEWKRQKRPDQK